MNYKKKKIRKINAGLEKNADLGRGYEGEEGRRDCGKGRARKGRSRYRRRRNSWAE